MSAQASRITGDLNRHGRAFNFAQNPGLAERLAEGAAVGIFDTMQAETDPSGSRWPALNPEYAKSKARKYPGRKIAERDLVMKDPEQLKGELDASTPYVLTQTYGTTEQARDEASWFQETREFYDLSPHAEEWIERVLDRHFSDIVK